MNWLSTLLVSGLALASILVGYLAAVAKRHIAAGDTRKMYIFLLTLFDYVSNSDSPELKKLKRKAG